MVEAVANTEIYAVEVVLLGLISVPNLRLYQQQWQQKN
jgi:hypothetical protein